MSTIWHEPSTTAITAIEYPEDNGEPIADNTLQFKWIVLIKENLDLCVHDDPDVFVAGDLLWYPVEGENRTRMAPDAMVAFGRPKGHRRSYLQWLEGGIAPQVVFEVLSPRNRAGEIRAKRAFYERHGVEEFYEYDPDRGNLRGWLRHDGPLQPVVEMGGFISPRLGIRFEPRKGSNRLKIFHPDGEPFRTYSEFAQLAEDARRQTREYERQRAEAEHQRAEYERQQVEYAQRAEALAAMLRAAGIDPDRR
jgi:Uma2 family endonuclease